MNDKNERKIKTQEAFLKHFEKYPQMGVEDALKFIFQSALGCEHLVTDEAGARDYIEREYKASAHTDGARTDRLDGAYTRVHLSVLDSGLSAATLAKLFCLSAKKEENGADALSEKIEAVQALVSCGKVALDFDEFCAKILTWKNDAYPAVHHSDAFKREYAPAYRVIANEYADFLDVFVRIDRIMSEKGGVTLAIDGGSASGKTTLAELISRVYDCNVFHMDDFFLRPEQRTTERLMQVGGNVDRERFAEEVLSPLSKRQTVIYRPFDCSIQALREAREVSPKSINVIEGAYSTHPELGGYYDFSLFLDVDAQCQRERILKRNSPDFARRFFNEWIPLENVYFEKTDIKNRADLIIFVI